ncbi:MAG: pyruvate kinase [Candidatus Thorarchaeota archaeon]|nr:pyruvate kinase [Candidatus Thorarchaeota archaeon]
MVFDTPNSKIVCTIGPASKSKEVLTKMIEAGMDVARLNLSHGDHDTVRTTFNTIRSIDDTVPILFDLQGPKIRIGEMTEPATLVSGSEFILSTDEFVGDGSRVSISYKDLPKDVKKGNIIALNDGIIRLRVKTIKKNDVITEVVHGGPISSRKGANIPGIKLSCKVPTTEDLRDLDLAAELEPDFIALSFVTEADDVKRLRWAMESRGLENASIISKIEHRLAIKNFDAILEASDGVMVARGDLGIEVPIEDVPILQRELIRKANMWAKPVIVATHMLESMTEEVVPTRAEVSDVAHAILERADAVMLSGETAVGIDPVGVVAMMDRIIKRAESVLPRKDPLEVTSPKKMIVEIIGNLAYSAVCLIPDNVEAIISATRSGYTARWISKFRPPVPVFAVTENVKVSRKCRLLWGVHPITHEQTLDNIDALAQESTRIVYDLGYIGKDKDIVFTSGVQMIPGRTNVVGVFHVKDLV